MNNKDQKPIFFLDDNIEGHNAKLCFIKRESSNYVFYRAEVKDEISKKLKEWLKENINEIKRMSPEDQLKNFTELDEYESFKKEWKEKFFKKRYEWERYKLKDLKKIYNNLTAFMIYIRYKDDNGDTMVVGQVRKIKPSYVLKKDGYWNLLFDGVAFNKITPSNEGVMIDKYADFIFRINLNESSEAIIFNHANFEDILDIREEIKNNAKSIICNSNLSQYLDDSNEIWKIVEGDRTLQRMIVNPRIKKCINNVNIDSFIELKNRLPDNEIGYYIDKENRKIKLPNTGQDEKETLKNRKKAIRNIIKVVGYVYSISLDNKHIVEGDPYNIK
jgi:hypothetical protein